MVMTDIHYLAQSLTDQGDMFRSMVEHGDGKLTNYVWEITDAAFEQAEMLKPDVIILSWLTSFSSAEASSRSAATISLNRQRTASPSSSDRTCSISRKSSNFSPAAVCA